MENIETDEDPPSSVSNHVHQAQLSGNIHLHNNFFEKKS